MAANSSAPFSLRIFVVNGDPDGLRIIERSNWTGKAIVFPRSLFAQARTRDEYKQTGVYILIGPHEQSGSDMIYIGEGDPVGPRLDSHYGHKDFWTWAVFITAGAGNLNKAHVQYIESRLIQIANETKRLPLDNSNKPNPPSLSEADLADMDVFLSNLLGILPILGIHAFERSTQRTASDETILYCEGRGGKATGADTAQGFIVFKDSLAARESTPGFEANAVACSRVKKELIANQVLVEDEGKYRFTQDYVFNSPSLSAGIVLGRGVNGREKWKDKQGRTLKEIQEALTKNK